MNCLITKQGEVVKCIGVDHATRCRFTFKTNLNKFLAKGGVRICCKPKYETLIIEHKQELTGEQKRIIGRMLKDNDYFCVMRNNAVKKSFARPIRQIPF